MNLKKSTLAAAVSTALTLGLAGEASAAIYAGAALEVDDLSIVITNADGSTAPATSFDFRTTTSSDLNGVSGAGDSDTCLGFPSTCGGAGAPLVLNSSPSSIGSTGHTDNAFTFLGPGGGQYGSADNVIWDAQLVGDADTNTQGIAEAELTTGSTAGAESTIRSTTGFTMTFTLLSTGSLTMSFTADPDQYAELIDATASGGTASSTLTTNFRLAGSGTAAGVTVSWAALGSGILADECFETGVGVSCVETADTQNLNATVSAPFGGSDTLSFDPLATILTAFGISITGLPAGTYSLTLANTQQVNVTRTAVPEPGALLLLGTGLAALGLARRRMGPAA